MTVAITRMEPTAAALRRCAAGLVDASVVRRLLALAMVLDGHKREEAARRDATRVGQWSAGQ